MRLTEELILVLPSQHSTRSAAANRLDMQGISWLMKLTSSDQPSHAPTCARACCEEHAQIMLCTVHRSTPRKTRPAERDAWLSTVRVYPTLPDLR